MKPVLAVHATEMAVTADSAAEYTLVGRVPSPHPQHKGKPMWFGSVRTLDSEVRPSYFVQIATRPQYF